MILLNQLVSAILQTAILTIIPFAFYLITQRRAKGFLKWLGFHRTEVIPVKPMIAIFAGFSLAIVAPYFWLYKSGALTYAGFTIDAYRAYGWSIRTIIVILLWAVIQTSLSEEIFFRGFLGNRLSHKFGWKAGMALQAAVFGLIHIISVWGHGVIAAILVFLMTGAIGYLLGWLSMRKADESIIYGWIIHAAVNIISPIVVFIFLL